MNEKILNWVRKIERIIVVLLLFSLLGLVVYATAIFLLLLFQGVLNSFANPISANDSILNHLHTIFGGFMLVLIGLELLQTIKVYLRENIMHVEVVLLVALIGMARHVIDLKLDKDPMYYVAIAALLLGLSGSYYLIKKGVNTRN